MAKNVPPPEHCPLRAAERPFQVVVRFVPGERDDARPVPEPDRREPSLQARRAALAVLVARRPAPLAAPLDLLRDGEEQRAPGCSLSQSRRTPARNGESGTRRWSACPSPASSRGPSPTRRRNRRRPRRPDGLAPPGAGVGGEADHRVDPRDGVPVSRTNPSSSATSGRVRNRQSQSSRICFGVRPPDASRRSISARVMNGRLLLGLRVDEAVVRERALDHAHARCPVPGRTEGRDLLLDGRRADPPAAILLFRPLSTCDCRSARVRDWMREGPAERPLEMPELHPGGLQAGRLERALPCVSR